MNKFVITINNEERDGQQGLAVEIEHLRDEKHQNIYSDVMGAVIALLDYALDKTQATIENIETDLKTATAELAKKSETELPSDLEDLVIAFASHLLTEKDVEKVIADENNPMSKEFMEKIRDAVKNK